MKKVITYGTFDLFHVGHLNIIKRAKALGDYLIVAVSSDAFNAQKGKKAYHSDHDRKLILEAIRYVDEVIFEESWDQKIKDVQEHDVDVFVMGDDWEGKFDFLKDYCEVVYLPRTDGISTNDTISFLNIADLQDLNIFLSEIKILLIVKLHPMDILQTVDFPLFTNIMIMKQNDFSFQLYPLLGATDFLLTDYSSVWIDYDILDRPMGFVMNDIDEYQKSRGLTFDNISEVLPGPILSDLESLKSFLKTPETYKKETQKKFNLYKDDQACYRLMHVIDKLNKNDLIF